MRTKIYQKSNVKIIMSGYLLDEYDLLEAGAIDDINSSFMQLYTGIEHRTYMKVPFTGLGYISGDIRDKLGRPEDAYTITEIHDFKIDEELLYDSFTIYRIEDSEFGTQIVVTTEQISSSSHLNFTYASLVGYPLYVQDKNRTKVLVKATNNQNPYSVIEAALPEETRETAQDLDAMAKAMGTDSFFDFWIKLQRHHTSQ